MKSVSRTGMVLLAWLLIAGCAAQKATVSFSPKAPRRPDLTYAVLPFIDGNAGKDRENYPRAALVVASAFETALMRAGHAIVSAGKEDVSVTGTVTAFYRGRFMGRYTTVGFDVKATDTKSGTVLWTGSHARTTRWDYKYDPSMLVKRVARELAEKLAGSGEPR